MYKRRCLVWDSGINFWGAFAFPYNLIILDLWNVKTVLSSTLFTSHPRPLTVLQLLMCTDLPFAHAQYLLCVKWGTPSSPPCTLSSYEASIISLKYCCSSYSLLIKMHSINDLKLLHKTSRAKLHQRLEQLRLPSMYVCLFLIRRWVLLSVLFMGWGGWINSGGKVKGYQEQSAS